MTIHQIESEIDYMMNSKFMIGSSLRYKFIDHVNNMKNYHDLINLYKIVKNEFEKRVSRTEKGIYARIH